MERKFLIIIPTYNEVENIDPLINKILELYGNYNLDILVVDDNSEDGTKDSVKKLQENNDRIHLIVRESKTGLGPAYIRGFKYALEKGYHNIIQMDADFSHDPKYLKDFFRECENYDMIIGSRYTDGINVVNWPLSRLLLSYFASLYTRFVCGLPLKDPTGGYKCINREVLKSINLDGIGSSGYSFQIEVSFRAWKKGFSIKEVPIIFKDREKGESKMTTGIITEALYLIWKLRILSFFKKL